MSHAAAAAPPRRWRARWIWVTAPQRGRGLLPDVAPEDCGRVGGFRRSLDLDAVPPQAFLHLTADARYRLYVNGAAVGVGPVRSSPSVRLVDTYDVAPLLRPGRNMLAVAVRFYGKPTPWSLPAARHGDLGYGGLLLEAPELDVVSDESWRAQFLAGPGPDDVVRVHGAVPELWAAGTSGWTDEAYDDRQWSPAAILSPQTAPLPTGGGVPSAPFTVLDVRPIPTLTNDEQVSAATTAAGKLGALDTPPTFTSLEAADAVPHIEADLPWRLDAQNFLTVDFGRVVVGVPTVEVAASAPAVVTVLAGELVDDRGMAEARPRHYAAHLHVDGTGAPERLTPFEGLGFRYVTVVSSAPVEVRGVRMLEQRSPRHGDAAFACDDSFLTRVWAAGARTREVCATDAYLDCPTREDRAWLGDMYVHAMVGYACDADWALTRWAIDLAASQPRDDGLLPVVAAGDLTHYGDVIPDYSLHWIRALRQYWWHSGDEGFVRRRLSAAVPVLDWFWRFVDDGVLGPVPGWVFLDANPVPVDVPLAALQALYVLALDDHAELARRVGDDEAAARSWRRAAALRRGFSAFWSPRHGAYLDGPGVDNVLSQRTQALAVLAGMGDQDRWQRALDAVWGKPLWGPSGHAHQGRGRPYPFTPVPAFEELADVVVEASPFFTHFLHQAMARAGRHDLLFESMRRWSSLLDEGYDTTGEHWRPVGVLSSRCHAWSATPTFDLTRHVVGVRPSAPGYAFVEVEPHLGPLTEVTARVPTPHGTIVVELRRDRDRVVGSVELPAPVVGTFAGEAGAGWQPLGSGRNEVR